MKPVNRINFFRKPQNPGQLPPQGQVSLIFDPAENAFKQINPDGSTSGIGGGDSAEFREVSASGPITSADNGLVLVVDASAPRTLTLTGTIPEGFNCMVVREGANDVGIAWSGGTLVSRSGDFIITEDNGVASLLCKPNGDVLVTGDV